MLVKRARAEELVCPDAPGYALAFFNRRVHMCSRTEQLGPTEECC